MAEQQQDIKPPDHVIESGRIGIAIDEATNRRLIESASVHLDLHPVELQLHQDHFDPEDLRHLELVIADEKLASLITEALQLIHQQDDPYRPAVIAAVANSADFSSANLQKTYDGVLPLPQAPANVAAQLSIALYAHRAFARRYDDTMEELRLNRQIFHSVTSGISVASAEDDLPLTYVNPSFEVITGYSLEESIGQNCRFLQRGDRNQPGLDLVREAVHQGKEVTATIRNYRKDGTLFWNELSMSPIRNRKGKITHFVGVQVDVTARVNYEHALRESEKLAVVGRLAASIAHEINNPLESVTNLVYLAEHSDNFEESRDYLSKVDQELRRIKLITSQSLRFYRQSTAPQTVHLDELIDSVLDIQKARLESAGVTVERRDRLHRSIVCLESEIRQVLNNLISNATDAMRQGGGRLLIRTAETTHWKTGETGVEITIADTGTGIPAEAISSLYKPFYSTKGMQGTGLGLWISQGIVNRHHGELRLRSRNSKACSGTVFRLYLPFQGVADNA